MLKYVFFIFCNVLFRVWSQGFPKTVVKDFTNPKFLVFAISKIICKTLNMRKRRGISLLGKAHKCQTRNSTWMDKITKNYKRRIHVQKRKDVRNRKKYMSCVPLYKSMHLLYYRNRKATLKNWESRESRILLIPVDTLRKNV